MSQPRPGEIRALSGARAFPPLLLVLFHYCEANGYRGAGWFDHPVNKGYLWVEFFFMLSGFVLCYAYRPRWPDLRSGPAYLTFLKTRLARLYPLHFATLMVALAMVLVLRAVALQGGYLSIYDEPYHPVVSWPSFIANLFLVQAWNVFPYLSWNVAAWFVSAEFLLCLLFPLYLLAARRGIAAALLLIAAGAAGLTLLAVTSKHGLDLTFHNGIFRGMAAFAIGVGLSILHGALVRRGAKALPEAAWSLAQVAALAGLLLAIYATGWAHRPQDIYTVLAMVPLIFVLSFDRGILAKGLQTRLPRALGEWSYAIYMGQTALLQLLHHARLHLYPAAGEIVFGRPWSAWGPVWHWLEPALLVAAAILWGYLLFAFVERPAARALRRALPPAA
jgi:peptidoglycan/LPS O-acetylase OafA/YrhL